LEAQTVARSGSTFKPGQSGNPGGRPKALKEVIELCRDLTAKGVERMGKILADDTAPPAAQVAAFNAVMDRGWGKVSQAVELSGPDGEAIPTSLTIVFKAPDGDAS
jgi:hypothetical protein